MQHLTLPPCDQRRMRNGSQPGRKLSGPDVSVGSIASFWPSAGNFRSTPVNGHRQTGPTGPFRANNRHVGFVTKDLLSSSCRIKKTLIARCMIGKSRQTRISRFEGAYYAQHRFSCRSCGSSRSHLFVASAGDSRERSNRRWCRRRTYRRGIARWGPGVTPCSTAAGLLCARGGVRRRARVPVRSRTLLGRLRLGIPPRRGLRLIVRCTDHRLLPEKCEERTTLARRIRRRCESSSSRAVRIRISNSSEVRKMLGSAGSFE